MNATGYMSLLLLLIVFSLVQLDDLKRDQFVVVASFRSRCAPHECIRPLLQPVYLSIFQQHLNSIHII